MTDLKNKKILITGGNGFLGSHLVGQLHAQGVAPERIIVPRFEEHDLRKWEECVAVTRGIDVVIHLAAKVGGIGFNTEHPGELFYDNIIMGVQMIEAARQADVEKFVALGTVCAYPKFTPVPFREEDIWNGYPEETNAPYGLAKKALLSQIQAYSAQYTFPGIYLLPVNLYGPGDSFDPERSHVIPALIKKVADAKRENKESVEVWGTGKATREFLYVEDAARGIILATEQYEKPDPVNLGSGVEIAIRDLAEKIKKAAGFEGEIRFDGVHPDGQPRRLLDVSRAKELFGFEAVTSFDEGLKKTIDWYMTDGISKK